MLAVTTALTRDAAAALASQIVLLPVESPVVVDLTAIPAFDSEGAAALAGLQERLGSERMTIVGFRQAAARLTGSDTPAPVAMHDRGWHVRRLRNLAVVQAATDVATTDDIERPVAGALDDDVAIVVVDLRGVALTDIGAEAIAFASSAAALRGQELLVVNVDLEGADRLRRSGLSATTYVAPADDESG